MPLLAAPVSRADGVFRHVLRQPLAFFTRTQTGALLSRMDGDINETQQAVGSQRARDPDA
jgi:ABC-type multidrug transport system fused ATPase/permease subunit